MSVNSKMTAIADKIRALLGVSGTMGLDAMSTNLGTVQSDVAAAFTAVGGKGGTVPSSKVSGNLASAINSIVINTGPQGVQIQKATGTIRTNSSGNATATVNFQPDIVAFNGGTDPNGATNYPGAMFTEANRSPLTLLITAPNSNYFMTVLTVTRDSAGFSVSAQKLNYSFAASADTNRSISYVAIKYT